MISAGDYLQPVSEDSPAGENCSYDDCFTELGELIEQSPSGEIIPEDKRWALISEKSQEILKNVSKHITVASYCAVSWMHEDLLGGFAPGMNLLVGMCDNFWENMFPERDRARRNAFDWFLLHAAKLLPQGKIPAADEQTREAINNSYNALKEKLNEKFTDEPLSFNEFDRIIAELNAVSEEEEKEVAQEAQAAQATGADGDESVAPSAIVGAESPETGGIAVQVLDPVETAFKKASTLQSKGNLQKAIKIIVDGLQTANGGREQFRWRISLCQLMLDAQAPQAIIKVHIDSIAKSLKDSNLAEWEPDLATKALEVSCRFWKYAGKEDKINECLEQLSVLNAASAFSVLT